VVAATIQPTTGLVHAAIAGEGAWRNDGTGWERLTLGAPQEPPRLVVSQYYLLPEQESWVPALARALDADLPPVMDVGFQPRAMDPAERSCDAFLGFPQDPAIFAAREWDIASSDLIIHEAGGSLTDFHGRRHRYNKPDSHIEDGLVVSASPELHQRILREIEELA
jgi:3'-phosphoadenosine 5'-phosphosulfate (PAPS) 3'-phosphatase